MAELFEKWKNGLERTRKVAFGRLATFFGATEITTDTWDELEAMLIQADIGIDTTSHILTDLIKKVDSEGITSTGELRGYIAQALQSELMVPVIPDFSNQKPAVIMVVGVNGSGKTTTLAKLGKKFTNQGKKVMYRIHLE